MGFCKMQKSAVIFIGLICLCSTAFAQVAWEPDQALGINWSGSNALTYYIDGDNGSDANDGLSEVNAFASFTTFANTVNAVGNMNGVIVYVQDVATSYDITATVSFTAAVIDDTPFVMQGYTTDLTDGGYVDIKGDIAGSPLFTVDNAADGCLFFNLSMSNVNASAGSECFIMNGDDTIWQNCYFYGYGCIDGDYGGKAYNCYFYNASNNFSDFTLNGTGVGLAYRCIFETQHNTNTYSSSGIVAIECVFIGGRASISGDDTQLFNCIFYQAPAYDRVFTCNAGVWLTMFNSIIHMTNTSGTGIMLNGPEVVVSGWNKIFKGESAWEDYLVSGSGMQKNDVQISETDEWLETTFTSTATNDFYVTNATAIDTANADVPSAPNDYDRDFGPANKSTAAASGGSSRVTIH